MNDFEKSSVVQDHQLKTKELTFEANIVSNATPANKEHGSDLPGVAVLRTEGKTAEADAVETISWTAPTDNTAGDSQFGLLLKSSELSDIEKVMEVTVSEQTALATSLTAAKVGSSFLTADGNIAIDVTGTGLALDSESPTLLVTVKYKNK